MLSLLLSIQIALAAPAPDFTLRSLTGTSKQVTLSEHRGRVVVLTFWSTFCSSCLAELGALQEFHSEFSDTIDVFAISVDEARDRSKIRPLAHSRGWGFSILWDQGKEVANLYNPAGVTPYTVVVAPSGEIALTRHGFSEEATAELKETVSRLLAASE